MSVLSTISDVIKGKATLTQKRSSKWPAARKLHLLMFPKCACCGGTAKIEVHHIVPFNVDPTLEMNPKNLITLCESSSNGITCHLAVGHLGSYQSYNKEVMLDSQIWNKKLQNRP